MFLIQDTKLSFCYSDRTIFPAFGTLPYPICHIRRVPTSTLRTTTGSKSSSETVIETRYGALQNNLLHYGKTHAACQRLLSSHSKFAKRPCRRRAVPCAVPHPAPLQLVWRAPAETQGWAGAGLAAGGCLLPGASQDNLPWLWFSLHPSDFSLPGFQSYFWAWWRVSLSFAARKVAVTILNCLC